MSLYILIRKEIAISLEKIISQIGHIMEKVFENKKKLKSIK